jgi:hypothetical protein
MKELSVKVTNRLGDVEKTIEFHFHELSEDTNSFWYDMSIRLMTALLNEIPRSEGPPKVPL